jgi:transposase-like protein
VAPALAEADRLCNAGRYERTTARRDQRSGSYDRKLQSKAGAVTLRVPKLRQQTFETAGEPRHGAQPQQEDLRPDRSLAAPADRGSQPYLCLDGIVLKRTWAGEVRNVSLLVAISVNAEGYRQILGIVEAPRRTRPAGAASWPISRVAA